MLKKTNQINLKNRTGLWRFAQAKGVKLVVVILACTLFSCSQLLGDFPSQSAIVDNAPSAEVGTIPGEFSVNGNGGATYTVPIEVPPGINGVQPNLSLVYNSQQGNGLLGVGWNLAGLSAISRCGKTIATDGIKGGINFDENDRFCFDGQRLMAVSGDYGADGTEYHTERETWVRVISQTVGGQNGPRSFTVKTKDGHQMEFGVTTDSRILARDRDDGAVQVWALNKISDRNGNFVEVSYEEDISRREKNIREAFLGYYPTEIRYTGNSGVTPLRLVKFDYEDRQDNITAYVGGSKAETTKRLTGIKTYVDLDGDGNNIDQGDNLVKQYSLTYEYGAATGRSRLISMAECDGAGACLPETELAWEIGDGDVGFGDGETTESNYPYTNLSVLLGMDVNGDGLSDLVQPYQDGDNLSIITYFSNGESLDEGVEIKTSQPYQNLSLLSIDVNGDNLSDLVQPRADGDNLSIITYFSNGENFEDGVEIQTSQPYQNLSLLPMDVNGDGLSDLVQLRADGSNLSIITYFSNGENFEDGVEIQTSQPYQNLSLLPMDVNGDGLSDLVQLRADGSNLSIITYFSNGENFEDGVESQTSQPYQNLSLLGMDVNGDGLSDLVQPYRDRDNMSIRTYFSNGENFEDGVEIQTSQTYQSLELLPMDVNGDGLSDLVQPYRYGNNLSIITYFSNGKNFEDGVELDTSYGFGRIGMLSMEVNGDGLSDLVQLQNNNSKLSIIIYLSNGHNFEDGIELDTSQTAEHLTLLGMDVNGDSLSDLVQPLTDRNDMSIITNLANKSNPDRLATITNGLGGQTQIEYKPLSDSTVYTKEVTETENNGTANSANDLGSTDVVVRGSIASSSDADWFAFDIPSPRDMTISVASENNQDLDWFLYQESNLDESVAAGNTANNPEAKTYNATNPGRYYLKVNGKSEATSPYTLTLHSSDTIVTVQNYMYVVS